MQHGCGRPEGLSSEEPVQHRLREPAFRRVAQVDPAGDIDRVDVLRAGAFDVGVDAVADGQQRALGQRPRKLPHRSLVDGRVGLSGLDDGLAERRVALREQARARQKLRAAFDHEIGIGADHGHAARRERGEHGGVILRRFVVFVEEAGANNNRGVGGGCELDVQAVEQAGVALRPQMEERLAGIGFDEAARYVAGGYQRIEAIVRHASGAQVIENRRMRPRRVRDQDDLAAPALEGAACLHG